VREELADYPKDHQLFIYTTSSDVPAYASKALQGLDLGSIDLEKTIRKVEEQLLKALAAEDASEDEDEDGYLDEAEDDWDDASVGGWSDDELHTDSRTTATGGDLGHDSPQTAETRKRLFRDLRNDLRQAKKAGFKVGVLGDYKGGMNFFVSLGIRVGKLGISEEAITAWKLDRTKYFIVLIHYSNFYQNVTRLSGDMGGYHARKGVDLCVGTASRYKPTLQEALTAFSKVSSNDLQGAQAVGTATGVETDGDASAGAEAQRDGDFTGIFISGPLNQLLNTGLVPLLKYRLQYGFGWDGAELYYNSESPGGLSQVGFELTVNSQPGRRSWRERITP
jgi:ubiquitin-conjugating enzyme E2 Q